ncbi:MAG: bifunctional adenosylcobinamide kinase/adenosylcobinamide-phosphate guanylyltransferase [Nitrospirae bacterium]|nr:bifunctional adenosylcobinamide kinase/adenosylcobinamide-phosphate guanylyltransferase [Nitrospirota bacterium]
MSNTIFIIGGARSGKSGYALDLGSTIPGRKGFLATAEALDEEMKERILLHQKARSLEWVTIEEPLSLSKRLADIVSLYDVVIVDCLTLWLSNMLGRVEDGQQPKGNENPPPLNPLPQGEGRSDRAVWIPPPLPGGGQGEGELWRFFDEPGFTKGHENQRDKNVPPILVEMDRRGFLTPPEVFSGEHIKTEIERLTSVLKDVSCKVIVVSNEVGLGIVPENKTARLFRDLGGWMNQKVAAAAGEVYLVTCGIPVKIK